MVILGFLLVLIVCFYGVWQLYFQAPGSPRGRSIVWRLACLIAAVRIGALWIGLAGLGRSNWLQVPVYFLLMLGWPDVYFARSARSEPLRWGIACSLILGATSVVWSAALLWLMRRLTGKPATRYSASTATACSPATSTAPDEGNPVSATGRHRVPRRGIQGAGLFRLSKMYLRRCQRVDDEKLPKSLTLAALDRSSKKRWVG
jgi:hypothetical protein